MRCRGLYVITLINNILMNNFNIAVLATAIGLLNQNCERRVIYDVVEREVVTYKEKDDNTPKPPKPKPKPPKFKFPEVFRGDWEYKLDNIKMKVTKDSVVYSVEEDKAWYDFGYSTSDFRDFKYKPSIRNLLMEYKKNGNQVELQISGDVISYKVFARPSNTPITTRRLHRK